MTASLQKRNLGIDLLRIFAMLMVVCLHVLGLGDVLEGAEGVPVKHELFWLLEVGSYCAVNCYALISGYVYSKHRYASAVTLWLQVAFYTVIISGIFFIVRPETRDLMQAVKSFFPIMSDTYWYFSSYMCLLLFMPFIGPMANNVGRKEFKVSLIIMTALFSVLSLISGGDAIDLNTGYSVVWLVYLFLLGTYIRRFEPFDRLNKWLCLLGYAVCTLITWGWTLYSIRLLAGTPVEVYSGVLLTYTSPTTLLAAVFLLLFFKRLELKGIAARITSFLAPLSFSVYIIHLHPILWGQLFDGKLVWIADMNAALGVLTALGITVALYLACSLIDLPRHYLFASLRLKKRLCDLEDKLMTRIK